MNNELDSSTCPSCGGTGLRNYGHSIEEPPCEACQGTGRPPVAVPIYVQMRLTLIAQVHELIDIAVRHAWTADDEEKCRTLGAIEHARKVTAPYNYNGWRAAPPQEVTDTELDRIWEQVKLAGPSSMHRCFARTVLAASAPDAARYRWLRDKSEPGICAFYLSVGDAFKGVKFARETVDEAIDAQIDAQTNTEAPDS